MHPGHPAGRSRHRQGKIITAEQQRGAGPNESRGPELSGLFEAVVARSEDAVSMSVSTPTEPAFRVRYVNAAFEQMTGVPAEQFVGGRPGTLVGPDTDLDTLRRIEAALNEGTPITEELTLHKPDGKPFRVRASYRQEVHGDTTFLSITYRDIEAGAKAAAALWRSEEWAQAILRGISDLVIVTDREGVITWLSPSVEERLGFEPADFLGCPCFDFIHPDDLDLAAVEWISVVTEGPNNNPTEFRIRTSTGDYRTFAITANPLFDHPAVNGMVLTATDVTEQARAKEVLQRSELWAQTLVQGGSDLVMVADSSGTVMYASPASRKLIGYEPDEMVGTNPLRLVHPDDYQSVMRSFASPGEAGEFRVQHRNGHWRILSVLFTDMRDNPVIHGILVHVRDVTAHRQAEDLLAEQADLLEAIARGAPLEITLQKITQMVEHTVEGSYCAVGMLDTDGAIRVRAAPNLPRQIINLLDELSPQSGPARDLRLSTGGELITFDLVDDDRFNSVEVFLDHQLEMCRVAPLYAPGSGELLGSLSVFFSSKDDLQPIEIELLGRAMNLASIAIERRRFESTLEYQALYDNLTGLPNRTLLLSRIRDALDRAGRLNTGVAVLFIDLDRFKVINDSVGHALGDQLLQLVGERLRGPLRPGDTLGRFGGDEFMIVCNRIADEDAAIAAAQRFVGVLTEPFRLGGGQIHATASIGISFSTDANEDAEAMIRNADVAMYRAKDQGRSQLVVFQELLDRSKVEQLALEQALRAAIEEQEFELHFQPVVDLRDGAMTHAEALVRWQRPGHGMVMPGMFIPLAEETGLIVPLGWWVLERACEEAAKWPELPGGRKVQIAINLSARQLASIDLIDIVLKTLEQSGVTADQLCFEITESDLVHDVDLAVSALKRLKSIGVKIAIDDFGTGYASLEYIKNFTMADYLKIDRSFVDGVEKEGSQEAAICSAAISMAKSLGLLTVAEGVETLFQMEALRDLDCDLAQGYLFSKPVPVADAIALMLAQSTI